MNIRKYYVSRTLDGSIYEDIYQGASFGQALNVLKEGERMFPKYGYSMTSFSTYMDIKLEEEFDEMMGKFYPEDCGC